MKRIITFMAICIGIGQISHAQTGTYKQFSDNYSIITNTTTGVTAGQLLSGATVYSQPVGVQCDVSVASGTPAGNVILRGSITGINYVPIGIDTLKLSTTNLSKIWNVDPAIVNYVQAQWIPTGTQSDTVRCYWITKARR